MIRDLRLAEELAVTDTLDEALRRIRAGSAPRILLLDLADLPAPIAEIGAARAVGGLDLRLVTLGAVNDVTLYRELLAAGADDYLIKPPSREALASVLETSGRRQQRPVPMAGSARSSSLSAAAAASAPPPPRSAAPGSSQRSFRDAPHCSISTCISAPRR